MIIKVTFKDFEDKNFTMLFGDSYKDWKTQVEEYFNRNITWWDSSQIMSCDISNIVKVEISKAKWIGWGGLKWCSDEDFQKQLNREGCQSNDEDNPSPRKYSDMIFYSDNKTEQIIFTMFELRMRHLFGKTKSVIKTEISNYRNRRIVKV